MRKRKREKRYEYEAEGLSYRWRIEPSTIMPGWILVTLEDRKDYPFGIKRWVDVRGSIAFKDSPEEILAAKKVALTYRLAELKAKWESRN